MNRNNPVEIQIAHASVIRMAAPLDMQSHERRRVGDIQNLSSSCRVLCLGPAEWWLVGDDPKVQEKWVVVDLDHALVTLQIGGSRIEDLLGCVCGIDVRATKFLPGTCARTRLAGVTTVLERMDLHTFFCYVPRSYSSYVQAALRESAVGLSVG